MAKAFTLKDFQTRFPTDDACLDHLMKVRFGETQTCAKCGWTGHFSRLRSIPAYACAKCGNHIHPMQGTPFARTHTALSKWFYAMWLFTTSRHGVSAKELQRQLGVTYKTAWRMGHEIRKYMAVVDNDDSDLSGHVEIDDSVIGGYVRGGKRGRHGANKIIVMGMVERGGRVSTKIVPDVKRATLQPEIVAKVVPGTTISTDEHNSYANLETLGYEHSAVNHAKREWARGIHHTNSIEGFWSILKRSIRSTHVHVSRKHLPKYLGEFEFRHNLRKVQHLMFAKLLASF